MPPNIRPSQSGGGGGGGVYEIKTLRSNLAPEEGGGRLFEGGILSSKYGISIVLFATNGPFSQRRSHIFSYCTS